MSNTYERFHNTTKQQYKIVNSQNFTYRIILSVINKYIGSNKKILDIGCGAGTLSVYLAHFGNQVYGIDISKKGIAAARLTAKNLHLKNVKFDELIFPDKIPSGKYDVIICTEVIEHLKDDAKAMKSMFNLLNKGGIVILSTPSVNAPMYRLGLANEFDRRVGHLRRYSLEKLINLSKENGFAVLETIKTEGVLRNFLFLNPIAGKSVRFIKFFLVDFVSLLDLITLKIFGESQLFVILQKPL